MTIESEAVLRPRDATPEAAALPARRGPLSEQLAHDLRRRLQAGEWAQGAAIPAETALAAAYAVSRNTVREAVSRLVAEGQLRIQRGVGTLVAPPPPPAPMGLTNFVSITQSIIAQGCTPRFELHRLERRAPNAEEADRLRLAPGERVLYAERALYSDDDLVSFGYERYRDALFPEALDPALFTQSFVDIFRGLDVHVDGTHVEFHAVHSDAIGWGRQFGQPQLYVMLDRLHWAGETPVFFAHTYCLEGHSRIFTSTRR